MTIIENAIAGFKRLGEALTGQSGVVREKLVRIDTGKFEKGNLIDDDGETRIQKAKSFLRMIRDKNVKIRPE